MCGHVCNMCDRARVSASASAFKEWPGHNCFRGNERRRLWRYLHKLRPAPPISPQTNGGLRGGVVTGGNDGMAPDFGPDIAREETQCAVGQAEMTGTGVAGPGLMHDGYSRGRIGRAWILRGRDAALWK